MTTDDPVFIWAKDPLFLDFFLGCPLDRRAGNQLDSLDVQFDPLLYPPVLHCRILINFSKRREREVMLYSIPGYSERMTALATNTRI